MTNKGVAEAVEALGYKMILYSDDPGDYADPGTRVIETRTLDTISDGGIILLHDGSAQTLVILPQKHPAPEGQGLPVRHR